LNNVEKARRGHSRQVIVRARDGRDSCTVVDDGRGFVVDDATSARGHLGLLALRERALLRRLVRGDQRSPETETKVEFWVPSAQ